jgi:threonine/homoserine/homoserine lactone efflux protein
MMQAFAEGLSIGLLLSAMIGPVFFTLIQNSLENGFRYAAVLALGILVSDLIYVILTYLSVSVFASNPHFEVVLGFVGGLVLLGFGISTLLKKRVHRPSPGGITLPKAKKRTGFMKGFSINGINPFVMLFWISIAGLVNLKEGFGAGEIWLFYTGILLTVFAIDLLKAFIAKQLSRFVTAKLMAKLNYLVGLVLIYFGGRLVWFAWEKHLVVG